MRPRRPDAPAAPSAATPPGAVSLAAALPGFEASVDRGPALDSRRAPPSVSPPLSLGVSFSPHARAVVSRPGGSAREVAIGPRSIGLTSDSPLWWHRVAEPWESVEICPDPALAAAVARELGSPGAAALDELRAPMDPVFWAAAVRVRAHLLGRAPLADLEADALVRGLLAHAMFEYLGVPAPRVNARPLDAARLSRLVEWIDAHLAERLTNEALAGVVAMSPYHFIRRFRAATGLTPHAFVAAWRAERAEALAREEPGLSRAAVARRVGYAGNGHRYREVLSRWGSARP